LCSGLARRPLKAVARVRIPSGLQVKPPLTRPDTTTSEPAFPRVARQGRARDARTPTSAAFGTLQISRLRCPNMGVECRTEFVLSRGWTSSGTAGPLAPCNEGLDDQASLPAEGPHHTRRRPPRCAIGLKDAGRRQKLAIAGGFPDQSPFSQNCRREMTNELDRLLTITDLSEMLGVPVDTLYGWRHRGEGPAGYRIGRHVRYRRAAVEAWLDTQADQRRQRRRGAH
jgi:excisionase family DNA binding protein